MSDYFCSKCGEYKGLHPWAHECPPTWEVGEHPDNTETIFAPTAEDAAAKYCEQIDIASADYKYIQDGGADSILVRPDNGSEEPFKSFKVSAETVAHYSAVPNE